MNPLTKKLRAALLPKVPHFYTRQLNGDITKEPCITVDDFSSWFTELERRIEALATEAEQVYGCILPGEKSIMWTEHNISADTHKALLICIEPIEPKDERVDVSEVAEALRRKTAHDADESLELDLLANRIEKYGIKGGPRD